MRKADKLTRAALPDLQICIAQESQKQSRVYVNKINRLIDCARRKFLARARNFRRHQPKTKLAARLFRSFRRLDYCATQNANPRLAERLRRALSTRQTNLRAEKAFGASRLVLPLPSALCGPFLPCRAAAAPPPPPPPSPPPRRRRRRRKRKLKSNLNYNEAAEALSNDCTVEVAAEMAPALEFESECLASQL